MGKHAAIVANTTWNIYNFRLNLIQKLLAEGWQVTVIAPLDEYIEYKEKFPSVRHVSLRHLTRDSRRPWQDIRLIRELKNIYQRIKPDVVIHYTHKPNIFGGFAARLGGIPSIAVVTGLGYAFIHEGINTKVIKALYKMVKSCHKKVIFENPDDLALFREQGLINQGQGVSVNGCGVDPEIYSPRLEEIKSKKTVFTFIGRLLYDKGTQEFVAAAQQIKAQREDVEFWVIGELDAENPSMIRKKQLLQWIEDETIVYHGFQKDVRPFIGKSSCVVLPSYREGMPRIVLEGMSMAKPIITTDTAGCRQTIKDGENGFLAHIGDAEDLADKMIQFLNLSPTEVQNMGEKGRALVLQNFNSEKIAQQLFDIISQV